MNYNKNIQQLRAQLRETEKERLIEIANIITPNSPFDFNNLKVGIKKLKVNNLTIQIQTKKQN